jgi:hypothetical protein
MMALTMSSWSAARISPAATKAPTNSLMTPSFVEEDNWARIAFGDMNTENFMDKEILNDL